MNQAILFSGHRGNASFSIDGNNSIKGWEEFNNAKQFFLAEFSKPFDSFGAIEAGDLSAIKKRGWRQEYCAVVYLLIVRLMPR